jgi:hypothetical protein
MMGFNKRYVDEESLRKVYKEGGYQELEKYLRKPDAVLMRDKFSQMIFDLIIEGDSEMRIKTIMK